MQDGGIIKKYKFKAWDKVNKRFFRDEEAVLEFRSAKFGECVGITLETFNNIFRDNDYFDWLMFTGLLDKNGKEICEGDIVSAPRMFNDVVEFRNGGFMLKGNELYETIAGALDHYGELEVIGNIYENADLLQRTHKTSIAKK